MFHIFSIIILCCICNVKSAKNLDSLYDDVNIVTELTPENFKTNVINGSNNDVWIIVFYSPLCPYSQALVPDFVKAAYVMRGEVEFGAVNGDKFISLRYKYGVTRYPFIKIFGRDRTKPWNYKGVWKAKDIIRASWSAEFNNCYYKT